MRVELDPLCERRQRGFRQASVALRIRESHEEQRLVVRQEPAERRRAHTAAKTVGEVFGLHEGMKTRPRVAHEEGTVALDQDADVVVEGELDEGERGAETLRAPVLDEHEVAGHEPGAGHAVGCLENLRRERPEHGLGVEPPVARARRLRRPRDVRARLGLDPACELVLVELLFEAGALQGIEHGIRHEDPDRERPAPLEPERCKGDER